LQGNIKTKVHHEKGHKAGSVALLVGESFVELGS
jgi:hypothetical protein